MRTCLLLMIALGGCAVDEPAYDVTLTGDSKADEIGGRRVHWEVGDTHDWFAEQNPELSVTVGIRGGTLMLLHADVAELRPQSATNQANYQQTSRVSLGITPVGTNIELAFIVAAGWQAGQDKLVPMSCGGTQMFKTLVLDFARSEITIDGTKTVAFSACGITIDPKDITAFRAQNFALLAVPWRTTDGSAFTGTYRYHQIVTVR